MQKLDLIENELVPVYETSTGEKVVYGTELYAVLEVKSNYRDWIKNRINDCEAVENEDFQSFAKNLSKGGRPQTEYIIKLDTAEEMAMLERTEIGKKVRKYFIQIEKKYNNILAEISPELRAILLHDKKILAVEKQVKKVEIGFEDFKNSLPLLGEECDEIQREKNRKIVPLLGGKNSPAYRDRSLRAKVYQDINAQLLREFGVRSYKAIKRIDAEQAVNCVKKYTLPSILVKEIEEMNLTDRRGSNETATRNI